jgi:hypothetical protein
MNLGSVFLRNPGHVSVNILSKILEAEKAANPAELKHKKCPIFIYKPSTTIDVAWAFSD